MNDRGLLSQAKRFISTVAFILTFAIAPAAAFATSYLPGQTLNPSCLPTDPTCIVVPSSATNVAAVFQATSTTATSTFAGGVSVSGTASSTNAIVSNTLTIGTSTGILEAVAGVVQTALVNLSNQVTGILGVANGGIGTSTAPSYGQVLVGNAAGGYNLIATSSLGIAAASSTLLANNNTFSGSNTFSSATTTVTGNLSVLGNITGTYPFTQTGTGAVTEAISQTLRRIIYADQFGTHHDGVTDDTTALNNALSAASAQGGGTVYLGPYQYLISSGNLNIPNNVTLEGSWWPGGQRSAGLNYPGLPYTLIVNPSYSIIVGQAASLQNVVVWPQGLAVPTSARSALTGIASFAGTAIKTGGHDAVVRNALVIGFNTCLYSSNYQRPLFEYIYGDCTNGMVIDNAHDIAKVNNVEFWPFYNANQNWDVASYAVSNVADNGSGSYRLTIGTNSNLTLQTGDTVWVAGVGGAVGANGKWIATVISPTQIDLQGSATAGSTVGATTTSGYSLVTVASAANIYPGQAVSGSGIPVGTTVSSMSGTDIVLSQAATSTATGVSLTFSNSSYTSGGTVYVDTGQRSGVGITFTNSEAGGCTNCYVYGYNIGIHLGTGAGWIQLVNVSADNNISLADPTTVSVLMDSSSYGTTWEGGYTSSNWTALRVSSSSNSPHSVSGVTLNAISTGVTADIDQGRVVISGSKSPNGAQDLIVGQSTGHLALSGDDFQGAKLITGNAAAQTAVSVDTATNLSSATPAGVGSLYSLTLGAPLGANSGLSIIGSAGDPNQGAQIFLENTSAPTSTWNKYLRVNAAGSLQILNSAYSSSIFSLSDAGNASYLGTVSGSGFQIGGTNAFFASSTNGSTFGGLSAGAGILSTATSSSVTSGFAATAFGYQALLNGTSTYFDTAFGYKALSMSATGGANNSGFANTAVGYQALTSNTSANYNTALGYSALSLTTTGGANTAVGVSAGANNTTGSNNVAFGYNALQLNQSGSRNAVFGFQAGLGVTANSFSDDSLFGNNSGVSLSTGARNLFMGSNTASTTATGNNNIAIGYDVALPNLNGSNQLDIGNLIFGTGINGEGNTISSGNVGVGTTTPWARLSVTGPDTSASTADLVVADSNNNPLFDIFDNGYVGIGTSTPGSLLSVAGNGFFAGNINVQAGSTFQIGGSNVLSASTTNFSTAVGLLSLQQMLSVSTSTSITSAPYNTAVGYQALQNATTTAYNVGIGYQALTGNSLNFSGGKNIAIGNQDLFNNSTGNNNGAIGYNALLQNTTGAANFAFGTQALNNNTTGGQNIGIGVNSLLNTQIGNNNVAIGGSAGTGVSGNSFSNNSLIGFNSGFALTTGSNNEFLGYGSASTTATGANNILLGYNIDLPSANGSNQLDIGNLIFGTGVNGTYSNVSTGSIGIGSTSPDQLLSVAGNVDLNAGSSYDIGDQPVLLASSTDFTTFAGIGAGAGIVSTATSSSLTSGFAATAFGYQALLNATSSYFDTAVGYRALQGIAGQSDTGFANTALGYSALGLNTSANYNTAVGYNALSQTTTGTANTAVGVSAGAQIIGGANNTAFGYNALELNQSGSRNAVFGFQAGLGVTANSFSDDSLFGNNSGVSLSTGARNLFMGSNTASTTATGNNNIAIGYDVALPILNGSNQLDIGNLIFGTGINGEGNTISSGNVGVGTTTPYSRLEIWGPDTSGATAAESIANNASTTEWQVFDNGNATLAGTLTQNSDQRLKTNVQSLNASSSLSLIDQLNPVTFTWIDPSKGSSPQLGFIAQQVQPIFPNLVATTSPTALTPDGTLSLNYIDLISPIVSAIQAISTEITSLENTVAGFADSVTTKQLTFVRGQGSEIDVQTGNIQNANIQTASVQTLCIGSTCVTEDQLKALLAAANQSSASETDASASDYISSSSTVSTPPVIQINGDNPATIQVGATYTDLGASVTGPTADLNLDVNTFVNGAPMNPVQIDTSAVATDTIDYVVTDQNGLTSTSTRTVVIEAATSSVSGL